MDMDGMGVVAYGVSIEQQDLHLRCCSRCASVSGRHHLADVARDALYDVHAEILAFRTLTLSDMVAHVVAALVHSPIS